MRLVENAQIIPAFLPVNLATAANTGDWVSLANYNHVAIVFIKGPGAAGEDPTITIAQASDAAGSDTKALTFTVVHKKQAATILTATGTFTRVTQTAAATFTHTDLGEAAAVIVIEFDAEELDAANGFKFIQASVDDVGSTSQIGTVLYILTEPRFADRTPVSAIA
jgi:hypothetical protein